MNRNSGSQMQKYTPEFKKQLLAQESTLLRLRSNQGNNTWGWTGQMKTAPHNLKSQNVQGAHNLNLALLPHICKISYYRYQSVSAHRRTTRLIIQRGWQLLMIITTILLLLCLCHYQVGVQEQSGMIEILFHTTYACKCRAGGIYRRHIAGTYRQLSLLPRRPSTRFSYPCPNTIPVSGPVSGPSVGYQI